MTYNRFIFDVENKKVIRDFESAYKNFENVYPGQFDIETIKFRLLTQDILSTPQCRVLDIGAGYGAYVHYLQEKGIDVTGIEISETAVQQGKEMFGPDLKLEQGDLTVRTRFADGEFDTIACFGVITWLMDKIDTCLTEIDRILKPNGLVAFSTTFKETNVFFRDVVSSEQDVLNILARHFVIENFFIHYHEIGTGKDQSQNLDLKNRMRDLVIFCRKK